MGKIEQIQAKYLSGKPVFDRLFNLKSKDLIEEVKKLLNDTDKDFSAIFNYNPTVKKVSLNDEPEQIELFVWDKILISPIGLYYKPEHGEDRFLKYLA